MGTPTPEELEVALEQVAKMREQGEDPFFIAKVLLNTRYRYKALEKVFHCVELYMHSGQGAREHSELLRAMKDYSELDQRTSGSENDHFGLG